MERTLGRFSDNGSEDSEEIIMAETAVVGSLPENNSDGFYAPPPTRTNLTPSESECLSAKEVTAHKYSDAFSSVDELCRQIEVCEKELRQRTLRVERLRAQESQLEQHIKLLKGEVHELADSDDDVSLLDIVDPSSNDELIERMRLTIEHLRSEVAEKTMQLTRLNGNYMEQLRVLRVENAVKDQELSSISEAVSRISSSSSSPCHSPAGDGTPTHTTAPSPRTIDSAAALSLSPSDPSHHQISSGETFSSSADELSIGKRAIKARVISLFDFQARTTNELSFNAGDSILIYDKSDSGWWKGELGGNVGLVPQEYIKVVNDYTPGSTSLMPPSSAASTSSPSSSTPNRPIFLGDSGDHSKLFQSHSPIDNMDAEDQQDFATLKLQNSVLQEKLRLRGEETEYLKNLVVQLQLKQSTQRQSVSPEQLKDRLQLISLQTKHFDQISSLKEKLKKKKELIKLLKEEEDERRRRHNNPLIESSSLLSSSLASLGKSSDSSLIIGEEASLKVSQEEETREPPQWAPDVSHPVCFGCRSGFNLVRRRVSAFIFC